MHVSVWVSRVRACVRARVRDQVSHLGEQEVGEDQGHRARLALVAVHERNAPAALCILDKVDSSLEVLLDGLVLHILQWDARPPAQHSQSAEGWVGAGGVLHKPLKHMAELRYPPKRA